MSPLIYYLLQVIATSGILYIYYHFALRNKKFHQYNRFYLLSAVLISIIIPFLNIPVYFTSTETESSFVLHTLTQISSRGEAIIPAAGIMNEEIKTNLLTWQSLLYSFYILVASITLIRIIFSFLKIRIIARNNPVEKLEKINFVNTDEPGTPFSIFRWLFWNRKIELRSEKGEQIFRHELFHIEQKHSFDIIFMELLAVVFWINPFFHFFKKEIKAIHEFLADQFAVSENKKWQYAELLLMQVLGTNNHLTNPFFHNQIKRRIAMITSSKKPGYQYFRKVLILPIIALLFVVFAFQFRKTENSTAAPVSKLLTVAINDANDTVPKTLSNIKPDQIKEIHVNNGNIIIHLKTGEKILATQNDILEEKRKLSQKQKETTSLPELKEQEAHIAAKQQMQEMQLKFQETQMAAQKQLRVLELQHQEAVMAAEKAMRAAESQFQEVQINAEKELMKMRESKQEEPAKAVEKEMQMQQLKFREAQMATQKELQMLELKRREASLAIQKELQAAETKFAESQIAVEKELILKMGLIQKEAQQQKEKKKEN